MPGRSFSTPAYKYGFNGQEKDDEVSGSGNSMTAEFWQYDSRLGRRWNNDPVVKEWESPYATFGGNPLYFADPFGLDGEGPNGECDGDMCTNPDGTGETFGNGGWRENGVQGKTFTLEGAEITAPRREGAQPAQEYGQLWGTDQGAEAIFPSGMNLGSGWSFKGGSDFYSTRGRSNMVQTMHDYPGSYHLFMPRTRQTAQIEKAFQDGGRDAVIGIGAGVAVPFVMAYGAIYGSTALTIANEKTIEYYFVTNIALNNFRNRAVSYAITFLVRRFGIAAIPAIQYLQKYGDKMDPMMLRIMLEAIVKKLAGSEATKGMTPTNYYMVPGTPTDPPLPNENSK